MLQEAGVPSGRVVGDGNTTERSSSIVKVARQATITSGEVKGVSGMWRSRRLKRSLAEERRVGNA